MNFALWILLGGAVGWVAYSWFRFNEQRGRRASIVIGMIAGCLGGYLIAPVISAVPMDAGHLNPVSLIVAFASAAAGLILTSMIHDRFGV